MSVIAFVRSFVRLFARWKKCTSGVIRNDKEQKWEVTLAPGEYDTELTDLPVLLRLSKHDGSIVGVELWDEIYDRRKRFKR